MAVSDPNPSAPGAAAEATDRVIQVFGGIRPMAAKLGAPFTTVQGWKKRGQIPEGRMEEIAAAAQANGITLVPGDLEAATKPAPKEPEAAVKDLQPEATLKKPEASAKDPEPEASAKDPEPDGATRPEAAAKVAGEPSMAGPAQADSAALNLGPAEKPSSPAPRGPSAGSASPGTGSAKPAQAADPMPAKGNGDGPDRPRPAPPPAARETVRVEKRGGLVAWVALVVAAAGLAAVLAPQSLPEDFRAQIGLVAPQDLAGRLDAVSGEIARLEALERQVDGLSDQAARADALADLSGTVSDQSGRLTTLSDTAATLSDTVASLQTRIDAVEDRPVATTLPTEPGSDAPAFDPRPMLDRLDGVEGDVADLRGTLSGVETQLGRLASRDADLEGRLSELATGQTGLDAQIRGLNAALVAQLEALRADLGTVRADLGAVSDRLAAVEQADRLDAAALE